MDKMGQMSDAIEQFNMDDLDSIPVINLLDDQDHNMVDLDSIPNNDLLDAKDDNLDSMHPGHQLDR